MSAPVRDLFAPLPSEAAMACRALALAEHNARRFPYDEETLKHQREKTSEHARIVARLSLAQRTAANTLLAKERASYPVPPDRLPPGSPDVPFRMTVTEAHAAAFTGSD